MHQGFSRFLSTALLACPDCSAPRVTRSESGSWLAGCLFVWTAPPMSGPSLCRQPLWLSLRHSCPAYSQLLYFNEKKKKGFPETILINHNGSLLRRQPPPHTSGQQASLGTAFDKYVCSRPRLVADVWQKQCAVLCSGCI